MKLILLIWISLFFTNTTWADLVCPKNIVFKKHGQVEVSPAKSVDLLLNGVGIRKVLFVKVMYSALYLENPSSDGQAILNSPEVKLITVHALRNIKRSQLVGEWDDEFERLCADQCAELRPYHDQFIGYARDVKKDERLHLAFLADRLKFITEDDEVFAPIMSTDYGKIMLESAVGKKPVNKKFKKGLLGKNKKLCTEV